MGSGSLLIKCGHEVGSADYALYGQENNGSTWALAKMNMFLHDVSNARMEWGDTLKEPTLLEGDALMRFNVVVANSPFSLDKWGAEGAGRDKYKRFHRGIPPKGAGDYAFITHMIEMTYTDPAQNGRVGVIGPHGVLFRGGAEGQIRRELVEENLLDAVIGLPPNLFFGTGIPAAILIFKRNRPEGGCCSSTPAASSSRVHAEQTAYGGHRPHRGDLPGATTVEKYAHLATSRRSRRTTSISTSRATWTPSKSEEDVSLEAVQAEITAIQTQLSTVETNIAGYLKELGL